MTDAWPDPAVAAATRGRRRRFGRRVALFALVAGAAWISVWLDLLDTRGETLVIGALLAIGFVRLLVEREAAGSTGPYSRATAAAAREGLTSNRLTELERFLDLAMISAGDAHHVLRPLAVDIAGTWLEATHGFGLDDQRAVALLPPAVWTLASPEARRPDDPHRPGPTPNELDHLVSDLEALT